MCYGAQPIRCDASRKCKKKNFMPGTLAAWSVPYEGMSRKKQNITDGTPCGLVYLAKYGNMPGTMGFCSFLGDKIFPSRTVAAWVHSFTREFLRNLKDEQTVYHVEWCIDYNFFSW